MVFKIRFESMTVNHRKELKAFHERKPLKYHFSSIQKLALIV